MRFKCLVFDHDDTVVNSTRTIHFPSFQQYLDVCKPGRTITYEDYLLKNFSPGFLEMCRQDYEMTDEDLETELGFWQNFVRNHIPEAFSGIREIMLRQKANGGINCVVSHSFRNSIERDYRANDLPMPDDVYGWDYPPEQRKPNPYPLCMIMKKFNLAPDEILVIDDLKPGYDMARACRVRFAAAGWAYDVPQIESFMRNNSDIYLKSVEELSALVQ